MTPAQWQKISPILESALELAPPARPFWMLLARTPSSVAKLNL